MYIPKYVPMYIQYFNGHTFLTRTLCAKPNILKDTINTSKLIQENIINNKTRLNMKRIIILKGAIIHLTTNQFYPL